MEISVKPMLRITNKLNGLCSKFIFCMQIVVLEKENSVIGVMIYLTRNISGGLMQDRKILFIDALAVDEKERGNGFGHQLLDYLVRLYKDLQYDGLELQVNAKNLTAMELYTKYGFTPKSINMELL